jgi:hypothetical protein
VRGGHGLYEECTARPQADGGAFAGHPRPRRSATSARDVAPDDDAAGVAPPVSEHATASRARYDGPERPKDTGMIHQFPDRHPLRQLDAAGATVQLLASAGTTRVRGRGRRGGGGIP